MRNWRRSVLTLVVWCLALGGGYLGYTQVQGIQFAHAEEKREALRKGLGTLNDLALNFREVSQVVEPSVVNISVRKKVKAPAALPFDELRRFFPDRDGDGEPDIPNGIIPHGMDPNDEEFMPEQVGTGSGVIIEVDGRKGYIVTNNHVAGGAEEILVTLNDGREIRNGKLLGADAKTDLAVVQIEADRLPPARWGDSGELQKGDWVLAFGSPFGYVGSMTHGIVSALNRQAGILGQYGYEEFIQVDAPINPGNSGGPLVNLKGEVVGINTAIASRNGGFQGIGFTIPSNQAKIVYQALKTRGKVVRGWLGVAIGDVAKDIEMARSFGFEGDAGVLVQQVMPSTPAEGRLQRGDIVTEIAGKRIDSVQQLRTTIANLPPGADVAMKVFRARKFQDVTVKLGEQPEDPGLARSTPAPAPEQADLLESLGLRVQTLTEEAARARDLEVQRGALVTRVDRNSAAARARLIPGDVVVEVAEQKVESAEDFSAAIAKQDLKKGVRLYVISRDGARFVLLTTNK